jgi:predicted LPLAT superfamily acyltransferase
MMRVLALEKSPVRVRVLMHEVNAEKIASVLGPLNDDVRDQIIVLGRVQTMLEVREALARGEAVGLLADRVVAGDRTRRCMFFGAPAEFAEGPFVLAAALRVPVVLFCALRRDDGSYRIQFERLPPAVYASERADRESALQRECERYALWLEARCREAPLNWFNFYDFWACAPRAGD